jgi:hypothetical protein
MREFRVNCDYYGLEIVAIASGLAYISAPKGDVILTLPRAGKRMGMLFSQATARTRCGRFRALADVASKKYIMLTPDQVWERLERTDV